jgi:hypothetical protein
MNAMPKCNKELGESKATRAAVRGVVSKKKRRWFASP